MSQDEAGLVASKDFVKKNSLHAKKLALPNLMPLLGFPRSSAFVAKINKTIHSRYNLGLFDTIKDEDGKVYNISPDIKALQTFQQRVEVLIKSLQQRRDWLQSSTRRVFGTLYYSSQESVCCGLHFDDVRENIGIRDALKAFVKVELRQTAHFNLARSGKLAVSALFSKLEATSDLDSIPASLDWLTSCDPEVQGDLLDLTQHLADCTTATRLLLVVAQPFDKHALVVRQALQSKRPVDCIALNLKSAPKCIDVLSQISSQSHGSFHAYDGDVLDLGDISLGDSLVDSADLRLVLAELQQARRIHGLIKAILLEERFKRVEYRQMIKGTVPQSKQDQIASTEVNAEEWLEKHSLKRLKLDFKQAVLPGVFPHIDGHVGVLSRPGEDSRDLARCQVPEAIQRIVPVHAESCHNIPRIPWGKGKSVHVFITNTMVRDYETRIKKVIAMYERKLKALSESSLALFGLIQTMRIVLVIDLSDSMEPRLQELYTVLGRLFDQQLTDRQFTLVVFGDNVHVWSDDLVKGTVDSFAEALRWLEQLQTLGSTNTLGALEEAFKIPCDTMYLISDGLPNQPDSAVEVRVAQLFETTPTPINTISFSCNDHSANTHLHQLATQTGGGFQYYTAHLGNVLLEPETAELLGPAPTGGLPIIARLTNEVQRAKSSLRRFVKIYNECQANDKVPVDFNSSFHESTTLNQIPPRYFRDTKEQSLANVQAKHRHRQALEQATQDPHLPTDRRPGWDIRRHDSHKLPPTLPLQADSEEDGEFSSEFEDDDDDDQEQKAQQGSLNTTNQSDGDRQPRSVQSTSFSSTGTDVDGTQDIVLPEPSAREWLRDNSLRALRLTMFDVLEATALQPKDHHMSAAGTKALADVCDYYELQTGGKVWYVDPAISDLEKYMCQLDELEPRYFSRLESYGIELMAPSELQQYRETDTTLRFGKLKDLSSRLRDDNMAVLVHEMKKLRECRDQAKALREDIALRRERRKDARPRSAAQGSMAHKASSSFKAKQPQQRPQSAQPKRSTTTRDRGKSKRLTSKSVPTHGTSSATVTSCGTVALAPVVTHAPSAPARHPRRHVTAIEAREARRDFEQCRATTQQLQKQSSLRHLAPTSAPSSPDTRRVKSTVSSAKQRQKKLSSSSFSSSHQTIG
eukprot:m.291283 g.291283  ORF g.291283 m.291283 type:complete len:1144 (+) comp15825_c4_seq2:336-3767(+)